MHYILFYDYVSDMAERRAPVRAAHLEHVAQVRAAGKLLMAGAFADPLDGAALIFDVESAQEIESFVENDPYVKAGLVPNYRIRQWMVVAPAPAMAVAVTP